MAKTILQIAQQVTGELALNIPSVLLSSSDSNVVQIKYLIIAACDELADGYDWQQLLRTHLISTTEGVSVYDAPSDYLRMANYAHWDRTASAQVYGNLSPQVWEALRSGINTSGPTYQFRVANNQINLTPTPGSSSSTIAFTYYSNEYARGSDLVYKSAFTSDDDTTVFNDRVLTNFVKLKVLQTKGFNTAAAANDFNISLASAMANNVPASVIVSGACVDGLIGINNVPSGNYGL